MSPVTIEAVYERVPTAPERRAPARVRLGFRARFSAGEVNDGTGTAGSAPTPRSPGAPGRGPVPPRPATRALVRYRGGGPRRGPREAVPNPALLGYAPDGGPLPLALAGTGGAGSHLDLLA